MPIELPGRNTRMKEPRHKSMASLINALIDGISQYLDRPFCLMGHSMGGWVAYALTQELLLRNMALPLKLYVSGVRSPTLAGVENDIDQTLMHKLKGEEFWKAMERRYGPNPNLVGQYLF